LLITGQALSSAISKHIEASTAQKCENFGGRMDLVRPDTASIILTKGEKRKMKEKQKASTKK